MCTPTSNHFIPNIAEGICEKHLWVQRVLMSQMIIENCKEQDKNMSLGWIDYRKLFDNVPHWWLLGICKIYKTLDTFSPKSTMKLWKVYLNLLTKVANIKIKHIHIKYK